MRRTIFDIRNMKAAGEKITMLTAYDYSSALIAERAGVQIILVGDSLGMVVHGHDTTLPVTVDDMILHARMVMRGSREALVVVDLPFMAYATLQDAVTSARKIMQGGGGQALKLEGGAEMVPVVRKLTEMGVPVMGHLGLTPQAQHQIGLRVQGKDVRAAKKLIEDALALQEAGAFGLVLEVVPAELAAIISERLDIPVIGIGAGAGCDGQVQVWHDVLGLFEGKSPRHAKRFAEIGAQMTEALEVYVAEVSSGAFPTTAQSASIKPEILQEALQQITDR